VEEAARELKALGERRERALAEARRLRVLSKRAILLVHRGEVGEAEGLLGEARVVLEGLRGLVEGSPVLEGLEAVGAALEEYGEAGILLSLVQGRGFPPPGELGLSPVEYVQGLADVPGELRRRALDLLRVGRLEGAEECLGWMGRVYEELSRVEEFSLLLRGFRRKMDVARGVYERTAAELAVEASRERLRRLLEEAGKRGV